MEEILLLQYSLYPQIVSSSVVMFQILTTCVSFDYVVNCENEWDFVIRNFIVLTNCVLPSHPNNHEISTGFVNSLPSQVAINL